MSMYLFDEHPIIANKILAREIRLNEALILQQINYWIEINKKTGKNFYEGRYWTYNSIRSWQENDFDYMSFETVKRTFARLEKQGYLITGNFNKDPRDKTKWYMIDDENLFKLYEEIEFKVKYVILYKKDFIKMFYQLGELILFIFKIFFLFSLTSSLLIIFIAFLFYFYKKY